LVIFLTVIEWREKGIAERATESRKSGLHEAALFLFRRGLLSGLEGILLFLLGGTAATAKSAAQENRENQTHQTEPAHEISLAADFR